MSTHAEEQKKLIEHYASLEKRAESLANQVDSWKISPNKYIVPRMVEAILGLHFPEAEFIENQAMLKYRFKHMILFFKERLQFAKVIVEETQKESRDIDDIEKFKEINQNWEDGLDVAEKLTILLFKK